MIIVVNKDYLFSIILYISLGLKTHIILPDSVTKKDTVTVFDTFNVRIWTPPQLQAICFYDD